MTDHSDRGGSRRKPTRASPVRYDLADFDWCWLVVDGHREGPMRFEKALERLRGRHAAGVSLCQLSIVGARRPGPSRRRRPAVAEGPAHVPTHVEVVGRELAAVATPHR
jgi:hypothetical protein